MSDNESEMERDFFVTGVKTYLDVYDAIVEFRRQAQERCAVVLKLRLDDINRACDTDWKINDLKDYIWRQPSSTDLGKKITVDSLGREGGLYFCLQLERSGDSVAHSATVFLYRERRNLADKLWALLSAAASDTAYSTSKTLFFKRPISGDRIGEFQECMNQAIDDFVGFIGASGGLKAHLG